MQGEEGQEKEQEKKATQKDAKTDLPPEYSPGDREIVATVIDIWKQDPKTENLSYAKLLALVKQVKLKGNQNWVLSEKRMKAVLKEYNFEPNRPKYTYSRETRSALVPSLSCPLGTKLLMTKAKGKALYATKNFKKNEKVWDEYPVVVAAPVEMLRLMRKGKCCTYCAQLIALGPDGLPFPQQGIICYHCTASWCSNMCKRLDIGHADTHHPPKNNPRERPVVNQDIWKRYEKFCLEHNWNAGFTFAMLLLHKIKNGPSSKYAKTVAGLARIRQDIRQQAVTEPGTFEFEQHEIMWKQGYTLLHAAVEKSYNLSYDEYIEGIGMVNINNVNGCIFELHANLNHNCEPNVRVDFRTQSKTDGIVITALTEIEAGQELLISYVNKEYGLDERQSRLRTNWGFICACARCKREKANRLPPKEPEKPALKPTRLESPFNTPPHSPTDRRHRRKSVHFDKNPVTLNVPPQCPPVKPS